MRYAILSDIHGNLEALTAVLDRLSRERIDRYLCLGDVVGYGADPEPCLTRVQQLDAVCVAGNHEAACLGKLDPNWFNDSAKRAILWTRDQLGFGDLDAIRRWPLTLTEGRYALAHASLRHPERFEYILDAVRAMEMARRAEAPICLIGHTHVPAVVEYSTTSMMDRVEMPIRELADWPLKPSMRYVINCGSVGQPRDGDPRAACAVIDEDAQTLAIVRVPYDIATAQRKIREAKLPEPLAERLAVGR